MIGLAGSSSNNEQANSASPTTMPTATSSPTETNKDTANANSQNSDKQQLKELIELAKKGKVPGVEYAAHTGLIDEVEADWGKPDQQEPAGKGIYATYTDEHVVFGFNKGSLIFDVRSSDSALQKLTLKQIEGALGKPDDTKVNGEDKIYTYQANDQFQLKFIIPNSTGKVGHISVFSE
ncbi:YjgB family protein [Paenibacillus sp.]|uniref:YjgB family protein n=1 Tax=Paenibacillus sp. TaxID=58172 RepID=UPI0028AC9AB4|nr:YjgB family protein [Paenibacillus sp.]